MLAVALVELLDAAARLDVTLTTREERMALRANVNMNLRLRGTRRERVAATADDLCVIVILRMNALLQFFHLAFPQRLGIGYKEALRLLGSDLASRIWGIASHM